MFIELKTDFFFGFFSFRFLFFEPRDDFKSEHGYALPIIHIFLMIEMWEISIWNVFDVLTRCWLVFLFFTWLNLFSRLSSFSNWIIVKLENYFSLNRLNLSGSKTEFITFSCKSDKRLQDSETVVGSFKIEKSNQCKYLGITIDKHLDFQTETKKELKKMAVGIKIIKTIQHKFPTTVLMLFDALVLSDFENSALFLLRISSPLLLSLEKQMNWALKSGNFRSSIRGSFDLRI